MSISCDSHRNVCIYQTATRLNLPPYRITIWLINDVILTFVYLLVELILGFITAMWHWKPVDYHRTRIDYHPCIRSEPTKCASHLRIKRSFKMKQEKRYTFQQSRLLIVLNGHISEASVIDSKYIKITKLQDFYKASSFTDPF